MTILIRLLKRPQINLLPNHLPLLSPKVSPPFLAHSSTPPYPLPPHSSSGNNPVAFFCLPLRDYVLSTWASLFKSSIGVPLDSITVCVRASLVHTLTLDSSSGSSTLSPTQLPLGSCCRCPPRAHKSPLHRLCAKLAQALVGHHSAGIVQRWLD